MAPEQNVPELTWAAEMPLLTNRFFLYDGLKVFLWMVAILAVLMTVFFGLSGSLKQVVPILETFAWVLAGLLYLFVVIAWVALGNRYAVAFRIGPEGVAWRTLSRRALAANRLALLAGAATGSLTGIGAGALAIQRESGSLAWNKLRRTKEYPAERVITLMNNWRVVARLYCTPENYAQVLQSLRFYSASAGPAL